MDKLEVLEKKIRQAAERMIELKEENRKLASNLKFVENEGKRAGELIKENDMLLNEKKQAAVRVEKVLKKLNTLNI